MKEVNDIKDQHAAFAAKYGPAAIVQARVTAVNDDDTIDVVLLNGKQIPGVQLKAVVKDGNRTVAAPVQGSVVLVGSINNSDEYVVLTTGEIESITAIIGGVTYKVTQDGFLLQKGETTLLTALTKVIQSVQKIAIVYGNNPDFVMLAEAQTDLNNLLL